MFQWPTVLPQAYPLAPYGGYPSTSSRARSVPSGRRRSTRGASSARGRRQGNNETPALDSTSQPSGSVPRSGRAGTLKPYGAGREGKTFNDVVWESARRWFVVKLWMAGSFFIAGGGDEVDRCATEAYEDAIREYQDTHRGGAALIAKYRWQPQGPDALIECRQLVSVLVMISVVIERYES
jgi:hypothetical protein